MENLTTDTPKQIQVIDIIKQPTVTKRRIQKDSVNRNYKCPCGKTYLSYPALFTHIKQKHDGKAPGQIGKPKGNNKGRPPMKKQDEKLQIYNASIVNSLCEFLLSIKQKDNHRILDVYHLLVTENNFQVKKEPTAEAPAIKEKNCKEIFKQLMAEVEMSPIPTRANLVKQRIFIVLNLWMKQFIDKQRDFLGDEPYYTAQYLNEFIVSFLPAYITANQWERFKFLWGQNAVDITYSIHSWIAQKKYTLDQVFRIISEATSDVEAENPQQPQQKQQVKEEQQVILVKEEQQAQQV